MQLISRNLSWEIEYFYIFLWTWVPAEPTSLTLGLGNKIWVTPSMEIVPGSAPGGTGRELRMFPLRPTCGLCFKNLFPIHDHHPCCFIFSIKYQISVGGNSGYDQKAVYDQRSSTGECKALSLMSHSSQSPLIPKYVKYFLLLDIFKSDFFFSVFYFNPMALWNELVWNRPQENE